MSDATTTIVNQAVDSSKNVTKPLSPSKSSPQSTTNNSISNGGVDKVFQTRLPWGTLKEKHNYYFYPNPSQQQQQSTHMQHLTNLDNVAIERKKPGEYAMHLITLNFIHCCSKKFDSLINGDKRVSKTKRKII